MSSPTGRAHGGQILADNPKESISFEYPIDSGVTTEAGETPFGQLQPYPITISQLGTGTAAIALHRQAGLLLPRRPPGGRDGSSPTLSAPDRPATPPAGRSGASAVSHLISRRLTA